MKRALAVASTILTLAMTANSQEIIGGFGLTLGQKYTPGGGDKELDKGIVGDGKRTFITSPPSPKANFTRYQVTTNAKGKIIGIHGIIAGNPNGMKLYEAYKKELDKEYGYVMQEQMPPKYLGAEYIVNGKMIILKVSTSTEGNNVVLSYTYAPNKTKPKPNKLPQEAYTDSERK